MAEEEKEEELEEKKPKKSKKSIVRWIVVAVAVVALGAGGFAGWKYYETHLSGTKEQKEQPVQQSVIWPMDSLIVNLMDDNGERYLKVMIQIEVSSQDCVTELDLLKPKITDSIIGLLSSKSYREIAGFEGKQRLKDEIAVRLNGYLTKGQVRRVYFTEFLIQ
ncbi:MAG: flagellar basal body-associated FliL family protein [Thermodesulfobacteriota bacterium]|nr:flagellar basal body-associated FliL family protein [Thermodesulfobacteriota bacterium]